MDYIVFITFITHAWGPKFANDVVQDAIGMFGCPASELTKTEFFIVAIGKILKKMEANQNGPKEDRKN